MIYKIRPKIKGYSIKAFKVHYSSGDEGIIEASIDIAKDGYIFFTFYQSRPTKVYFQMKPESAEVLPYISQLYQQIKKHCETWLANPVEPFPWETQQEFEENMKKPITYPPTKRATANEVESILFDTKKYHSDGIVLTKYGNGKQHSYKISGDYEKCEIRNDHPSGKFRIKIMGNTNINCQQFP